MPHDLATFAEGRGFTEEELSTYGIRMEDGHVIIPVLGRAGPWYERTHCFQGCCPKYRSPKGAANHLFNPLGIGPPSPEVWLAEGEFDTLSLVVAGAPACGTLGKEAFVPYWSFLFGSAEAIVIAFDPDIESPQQAQRVAKLTELFGEHRTHRFDPYVESDGRYMDLNEWLAGDGDEFVDVVQNWEPR